jgi:hypothetical protein
LNARRHLCESQKTFVIVHGCHCRACSATSRPAAVVLSPCRPLNNRRLRRRLVRRGDHRRRSASHRLIMRSSRRSRRRFQRSGRRSDGVPIGQAVTLYPGVVFDLATLPLVYAKVWPACVVPVCLHLCARAHARHVLTERAVKQARCCHGMLRVHARSALVTITLSSAGTACCSTAGHPETWDTVPCRIPCRAGYRAVWDTVPCGIPCRVGYRAVRGTCRAWYVPCVIRAVWDIMSCGHRVCRTPRITCSGALSETRLQCGCAVLQLGLHGCCSTVYGVAIRWNTMQRAAA